MTGLKFVNATIFLFYANESFENMTQVSKNSWAKNMDTLVEYRKRKSLTLQAFLKDWRFLIAAAVR